MVCALFRNKKLSTTEIETKITRRIKRVKSKIVGKITHKVYLLGGGAILYSKKQDPLIAGFDEIKSLCDDIKTVEFIFDTTQFHIDIHTTDGKKITYKSSIDNKDQQQIDTFRKAIILEQKEENSKKNCQELFKILDFMRWDYENNDFMYPLYGIPKFLSDQIESYKIKQSSENLSSWQ